jgi:hypothetical protein
MKDILSAICCLLALFFGNNTLSAQQVITVSSLLGEMTDRGSVTHFPGYRTLQASSYDRHSTAPGQPGWFANADASQFIRTEQKNGHKEYVMMDADGPGAIVRFWLTTMLRPGNLRIYFDNSSEPAVVIPAYDLMKSGLPAGSALLKAHSSYNERDKGGSTLYLPLPYAKHCTVTWEEPDSVIKQPRYYQINYRTYPAGTKVKTFSAGQLSGRKALIAKTNELLWHPAVESNTPQLSSDTVLASQQEYSLELPHGVHAIDYLKMKIGMSDSAAYEKAFRSLVLKISFDGEETVRCPLGDFIGSGAGGRRIESWYRSLGRDSVMTSRWIMPYQKTAVISILNTGNDPIPFLITAGVRSWKWTPSSLYFHASYRQQKEVWISRSADSSSDWKFAEINGRGIYLGNTLSVFNHMHSWYGEGDQKIWVDDEKFPGEFGTGTEDYYNTSWAPVVLYQTPFANAPRADNPDSFGENTFTRTRNLDGVPFHKKFVMTLETLGWTNGTADFSVTTYWYGAGGATANQ